MSEVWIKALMAEPPRMFGRRLKPFALIHRLVLRTLESPLVTGQPASPIDIYLFVAVCSRSLAELRRDLFRIARWKRGMRWVLWWNRAYTESVAAKLRDYIEDFNDTPRHWQAKGGKAGKAFKAPYEFHMVRVLCGHYGYTQAEAWNERCGYARCLYDTFAEAEYEDTSLVSEYEEKRGRLTKAAKEAMRRGDTDEANRLVKEAEALIAAEGG